MEESFKPNSLTINKLLTDSDALYQIPIYQRPYKWSDDEIDKLWDDILESFYNQEPNYFLGSIITAASGNGTKYLDVVDGQQRLTTLIILMATIRDLYPNINRKQCEEDPFAVGIEQIKNAIMVSDKFGRLRLATHSNHSTDFDKYIIKGNILEHRKPYKKDLRKDEAPEYKFINTSVEFRHRLEELGESQAGELLNYIFNQIKIIRIDCSNVGFAIKLFQVLNARGLDLTNSDLIKSFLIGKLHMKYDSEVVQSKENQFLQDWIKCEDIALDVEESMNELFVMYEYFLLAANPKKSLYDELERQFENEDPLDVISDFKAFILEYQQHVFNSKNKLDYSFFYLRWSIYWKTVLTTALHTGYPDIDELKQTVRRFFYLFWIAGFTLTRIKQTTFNLIKWLKEGKLINEIKYELEKNLKENKVQDRIESALTGNIYHEQWCKPLLILIEYNQIDNPEYISLKDRNIHVEHILPQNFHEVYGWKHVIEDDRDGVEWVNSLGNLTLISGKKNIQASNDAFENKIGIYQGKGKHGTSDDKITSFRITQNIFDAFNQKKIEKWDIDSIAARRSKLLGDIEEILQVDLFLIR
ncbi:DUF262 domain-containing protein [Autumnicola psychrophila]|uniref:DUF262 domain-containing protein n=1 Tax=Autumnicola psychrophila TaxID=3075592 RepID=A0ABU3DPE1_9FLAO|nr:DUF262 domain-containing protein [Zunongwangia sp. F225]MDT0685576.1 DUF262 domain-containing protein [Zunongwangia sp. F225]